jgi:hypothetical protein
MVRSLIISRWLFLSVVFLFSNLSRGQMFNDTILYHADYEEGDIFDGNNYGIKGERCCDYSVTISENIARKGRRAVRFESRRQDPRVSGSPGRAELKVQSTDSIVQEWYAWSIYTPDEMTPDEAEILGQWHGSPDFEEGESWRSPPLSVCFANDEWSISGYYASQVVNDNSTRNRAFGEIIGPAQKNVWTDWVFHIHWDYRDEAIGGHGFVEVWQQVDEMGYKKVIDYKGPIGYNDKKGVYMKWGIYKYPWNKDKTKQLVRIHYYDEIKISNSMATFDQMKVAD